MRDYDPEGNGEAASQETLREIERNWHGDEEKPVTEEDWDSEVEGERDEDESEHVENTEIKLPKTTEESVDIKLKTYLLEPTHPDGGSKAKWFEQALGFNKNNVDDLAKQITFDSKSAIQTAMTEYGTKYSQIIAINGVNGRVIDVEFVWIRNNDNTVRLVTAIPTKK